MKTKFYNSVAICNKILTIILLILIFNSQSFSQEGNLTYRIFYKTVNVGYPGPILNTPQIVTQSSWFFDTSIVDRESDKIDLVTGKNGIIETGQIYAYATIGSLYKNISNDTFNLDSHFRNEFYNYQNPPIKYISGLAFVKLRNESGVNDVVVSKTDTLFVFENDNGNGIIGEILDFVAGANSRYVTRGILNSQDEYEDVLYNDIFNRVRFFKSDGDGTLDHTPILVDSLSNGAIRKIIAAQVDFPILPYSKIWFPNETSNRDEVVVSKDDKLYIYGNDNDNTFTLIRTYDYSGDLVRDFDVADFNNDGYNDLLVAVERYDRSFNVIKLYLNNGAGNISSGAIYSNSTAAIYGGTALTHGDFNKDGYNDFVVGRDTVVTVFLNVFDDSLFYQTTNHNYPYSQDEGIAQIRGKKLIAADLHNLGGLSLIYSGAENTLNSPSVEHVYSIYADDRDLHPAPPLIFKETIIINDTLHPRLRLFSRGERDFQEFRIYRETPDEPDVFLLIAETANNFYVDESIDLYGGSSEPPSNVFYYAISVDNTNYTSGASEIVSYVAECEECGWDNLQITEESKSKKPRTYDVSNYPNPFNPVAKINYSIPLSDNVKITIYNSIGQAVLELINEFKDAGYYSAEFNGSNFASGMYYYRIVSGSFNATRKMMLLK